jgi:hypothetical protein
MMAGRSVARALATALVTLVALVVGYTANALAAAPQLAITQPLAGSFTNNATFSGTSNDALDAVTLKVYTGASVGESPVLTLLDLAPVELAPGEASWEIPAEGALDSGEYTAVAEQLNSEGESATSVPVTFMLDTVAPAVSINALASPTEDPRPSLSGGAGVEAGDQASVEVVIFSGVSVEGTRVASATAAVSEGTWSYTAPLLTSGTYTAQAYQRDEAGNIGVSSAITFTVATKPPAVTIDALPPVTNDPTPTITGTRALAAGDEPAVTVSIHEGKTVTGKPVASGSASLGEANWSYAPAAKLADGTYTVQASQGNESGEVGSATETFTVDTTPPAVSIASPVNDSLVEVSRPTLAGHAGHATGDEQLVTLKIFTGTVATGTPTQELKLIPNGSYQWSTGSTGPVLADGIYTARVEQSDEAGNVGKSTVTFAIKTNAPTVTLDQSAFATRAGKLVSGPEPSFSGTGGSEAEDSKTVLVKIYRGASTAGTPEQTVEATLDGTQWTSHQAQALPGGTYTVQAEQADANGKAGVSESVTFTVDASSPQVVLTAPENGSASASAAETVSGIAGTAEGDLDSVTVKLYAGATASGTPLEAITVQVSGENWSAVFGGLAPGTYTARAQQSDDVGNTGYSEAATFIVTASTGTSTQSTETQATQSCHSAPAASFKWIPAAPVTGEAITLVSTSTDSSSPITGYAWSLAGNGVFAAGEPALTSTFSTPGSHVVQLQVTDAAGQASTVAEAIPVSVAPVPLMEPFPVVHMAGSFNASGARITLLSVLAPVGAKVTIACHGPHCPARSLTVAVAAGATSRSGTALITLRRFERSLHAGVVLEIWVSAPGEIGKFTRFAIHRGKSPSRLDECASQAGATPIACPS